MKHQSLILGLLLFIPMAVVADNTKEAKVDTNPKHDAHYMLGAVPVVNGVVTFSDTLNIKGKDRIDIYNTLNDYVKELVDNGSAEMLKRIKYDDLRNRIISEEPLKFSTIAKVEEIITFHKAFLSWDHTFFRYTFILDVPEDGKAILTLTQVSYCYEYNDDEKKGEIYKAEEWITDEVAVKKSGDRLYPRSGKFRRHTIDRVADIFKNAKAKFKKKKVEAEEDEE